MFQGEGAGQVRDLCGLMGQRFRQNPPYEMRQNGLRHKLIAQAVYGEKV